MTLLQFVDLDNTLGIKDESYDIPFKFNTEQELYLMQISVRNYRTVQKKNCWI